MAALDLVTTDDIAGVFGIPTALDTGWRSEYFRPGLRCAWALKHDDHEHGLVFYECAAGTLESLVAEPEPVAGIGDWCVTGATVISTQVVRFGARGGAYSLELEQMRETRRPQLLELARLLARACPTPHPAPVSPVLHRRRRARRVRGARGLAVRVRSLLGNLGQHGLHDVP